MDVTNKCDKSAIEDLLQYAIGYGYYMVHGGTTGGVQMYEMDQETYEESIKNIWKN